MTRRAIKRPNLHTRAEQLLADLDTYLEKSVRPYLQRCLDRTQARLWRHQLGFVDGMGTTFFTIDGEPHYWLTEAIQDAAARGQSLGTASLSPRARRYADKFPLLVEIVRIRYQLDELFQFRLEIGDLEPTPPCLNLKLPSKSSKPSSTPSRPPAG